MNTPQKDSVVFPLPRIDSLWNYNKLEETEAKFRALIPEAKKAKNNSYYAELLTQLARTQSIQNKFQEAHELLDTVEEMLIDEEMPIAHIRCFLERGRTYNSSIQKEKAICFFKKAYEMAVKYKNENYAVDAMHMLGIAETPTEQLYWNLEAIKLVDKSSDIIVKRWLGPLYNNTGWTCFELKEYSRALNFFEKSLEWRIEYKDENGIYISKWCIAKTYRFLERIDDAIKIHFELLKEKEDGYVYEELSECLLVIDKKEEAKRYFKQAYEILSQDEWLRMNEQQRLNRLYQLANE